VKIRTITFISFLATAACARGQSLTTPAAIRSQIQKVGAKNVIAKMTAGGGSSWNHAITEIESGDANWLAIAKELRAGSDAGNTESIYVAVSHAALNAPARVLRMIGDAFPMAVVCTMPDIEPTAASLAAYIRRAEAAMASVQDPSLKTKRDQCVSEYRQLLQN
jgi:hypothetical protein